MDWQMNANHITRRLVTDINVLVCIIVVEMVVLCPNEMTSVDNMKYAKWFDIFHMQLSVFQKFAIKAIIEGEHSLSCVPTGSGKTIAGIFAIEYFTRISDKRIIYTSPIKSLSNQKYYEFKKRFPDLSIGLLTGDIKINPDAQVLIMTAEILQNSLLRTTSSAGVGLSFVMDFDTELACIIHDEIHMINDADRGHVWENIILSTPKHIQMVMLSATLDHPEKFAEWIELHTQKSVYLTCIKERPVPLTHYGYITCCSKIFKKLKNEESVQKEVIDNINKLFVLQSASGEFNEANYNKITKMCKLFRDKEVVNNRQYVLNQVTSYMKMNEMFPAVCFILSKKQIQQACREVTTNLLEDDSKIPYITKRECERILREKLPNFEEYLGLPDYLEMVALLEKGIAIHHSGVPPILREIVELLFEAGHIKLLFATETFSVGLNMPIKTAIFTDIYKFDGHERRILHPYEYNQASGRAGRRGIDKVGNVIHLHNLFSKCKKEEYKIMLKGAPQRLISKFKFSYNLILNMIANQDKEKPTKEQVIDFCSKSLLNDELVTRADAMVSIMEENTSLILEKNLVTFHPIDEVKKYMNLLEELPKTSNKKRKLKEREIVEYRIRYKFIDTDRAILEQHNSKLDANRKMLDEIDAHDNYIRNNVRIIFEELKNKTYIALDDTREGVYVLTRSGEIARELNEVNCLAFAKIIDRLSALTEEELVCVFSCFTGNIQVNSDEKREYEYKGAEAEKINKLLQHIQYLYFDWGDMETKYELVTGLDYTLHYDLINYMRDWIRCGNEIDCKIFLGKLREEKEILLGDFIKAVTKINNIVNELNNVVMNMGLYDFASRLQKIPALILKYVVTEQSLYV